MCLYHRLFVNNFKVKTKVLTIFNGTEPLQVMLIKYCNISCMKNACIDLHFITISQVTFITFPEHRGFIFWWMFTF